MENKRKLQIYKGIIQYILESTSYTLMEIAQLSSTSIKRIRAIHNEETLSLDTYSELSLINLYRIILDLSVDMKFIQQSKALWPQRGNHENVQP